MPELAPFWSNPEVGVSVPPPSGSFTVPVLEPDGTPEFESPVLFEFGSKFAELELGGGVVLVPGSKGMSFGASDIETKNVTRNDWKWWNQKAEE